MADFVGVVQTLLYGLINGSVIAVGAVGLTLSYGVTRFINFAYGELLTLGAYTALLLVGMGLGLPVAAVVAVLVIGVGGVLVARVFYDPLSDRGALPCSSRASAWRSSFGISSARPRARRPGSSRSR
ncbi:hypothetical protein ACFQJD_07255 [Haloplanus sp. GCM10025708]|uniref:ABC transporter permease subunit n=1 Tax=Haloplanus sp. GCM10025708 TaxID=3252679 RepID=UPI003615732D